MPPGRRTGSKNGFIQCKDCKETSPAEDYGERRRWGVCPKCESNQLANRYKAERRRNSHLKSRYGIDQAEYVCMYEDQEGKCAICLVFKDKLYIDHCHRTGKLRALLCFGCNSGIGQMKDNAEIVLRAAQYLAAWDATNA